MILVPNILDVLYKLADCIRSLKKATPLKSTERILILLMDFNHLIFLGVYCEKFRE